MYKVYYQYQTNTKCAFVAADSVEHAKKLVRDEFLVGAVDIIACTECHVGMIVYPNGRF